MLIHEKISWTKMPGGEFEGLVDCCSLSTIKFIQVMVSDYFSCRQPSDLEVLIKPCGKDCLLKFCKQKYCTASKK